MARIHWFVAFLAASIFASIAWFTSVAINIADAFGWPVYHPSPGESIAIDSATRDHADGRQPGIASRFANFLSRALTHDEFTADHYDPGWRPA